MSALAVWVIFTVISSTVSTTICLNGTSDVLIIPLGGNGASNCTVAAVAAADNMRPVQYRCPSLQSALLLTELAPDNCHHYNISLQSSTPTVHVITQPIVTRASVTITGSDHVVITCNFSEATSDIERQPDGLRYAIYFNKSHTVHLRQVTFRYCSLPIRILQSDNVIIEYSTFRYFTEAVFDVHNCHQVNITKCSFLNNSGTGITQRPYRGNTGALSITYYNLPDDYSGNPNVTVRSCTFRNNSALATNRFKSANQVFSEGVLTGRGGAMAVFVRENFYNVTVIMQDCYFEENYARSYAGSCYYLFNGLGYHRGVVDSCRYVSNRAILGGAGQAFVGTRGSLEYPHEFTVRNCTFHNNQAKFGAGLYYSIARNGQLRNKLSVKDSLFTNNSVSDEREGFGAAIAAVVASSIGITDQGKESFPINSISNCLVANNTAGVSSIVSIGFQTFEMLGFNYFIGNTGSALRIIYSRVKMAGIVEFINNTVVEGAALYLLSFSQIQLSFGVNILFKGNTGRYGASIFASSLSLVEGFRELPYNPQCFFVLETNSTLPPSLWKQTNISIKFESNTALFGAAVYATSLSSCSWTSNSVIGSFNQTYFPSWPIFYISNDNRNTAFMDQYNQVHSIVTDAIVLYTSANVLRGWPGQTLNLSLTAIDELGNPTGSLTHFTFTESDNEMMIRDAHLTPNTILISREPFMANFKFQLSQDSIVTHSNGTLGTIAIYHEGTVISNRDNNATFVTLVHDKCIGGYTFNTIRNRTICVCDESVEKIVSCENDEDSLIIQSGQWATRVQGEPASLYFYWCPPGYCQCYFNTSAGNSVCASVYSNINPDIQCDCTRKGILCGECKEGGVSVLLNRCVTCSEAYLIFIPLLVILDIVVISMIVLLSVHIPQWSYPFLFYIQMVPLVTLTFPPSFINVGKYLYYISSALGFYFVYDFCLMSSLSTLVSYSIRFIPFITAAITIILVLLLKSCTFIKFSALRKTDGVWTVLLLGYTHVTYTSLSVLNCPNIPQQTNSGSLTRMRWFFDGSVLCFADGHVIVSIIALFVLLVCVTLIPVTLALVFRKSFAHGIFNQLQSSFKQPFQRDYWCAVELGRRLPLLVLITALPGDKVTLVLYLMILLTLYGYISPYKKTLYNVMEMIMLTWFIILLMLSINPQLQETLSTAPGYNLTSIPQCHAKDTAVTMFSSVLAVFYYIPIAVALCVLCLWIIRIIKNHAFRYKNKPKKFQINNESSDSFESPYSVLVDHEVAGMTTELINPNEWIENNDELL